MAALRNIFSNTFAAVSEAAAAAAAATAAPGSGNASSSSSRTGGSNSTPSIINVNGPLPPPTHNIERYIDRACGADRYEPDLALNLEICDLINAKGGNCPRIAAVRIVRHVNSTHTNTVRFALDLLDMCAKNCGFPFHLQIASKDFLNTLVRRFPVHPPSILSSAHLRTLELLEQWNATFAQDNQATYADLSNVRRMHALLLSKGYVFPVVSEDALSMLSRKAPVIRCADDIEAEEVAVKRARLQELLRKQRPEDLEEANRLVKQLVGYDESQEYGPSSLGGAASTSASAAGADLRNQQRQKYLAMEEEDISRAISRAKELESFLLEQQAPNTAAPLTVAELARSCRAAQQAVVKITQSRDTQLDRVLELSDLLNRVLALHDGGSAPLEKAPSADALLIDLNDDTQSSKPNPQLQALAQLQPQQQNQAPASQNQQFQPVYMRNGLLVETSWTWTTASQAAGSLAQTGQIDCHFTNSSEQAISDLSWQIAVPKNMQVTLGAITSTNISAKSAHGAVTQCFSVTENCAKDSATSLLLSGRAHARFRVQFKRHGTTPELVEDEGVIPLGASAASASSSDATPQPAQPMTSTSTSSPGNQIDLLSI